MPADSRPDSRPLAVRAVASVHPSRWPGRLGRPVRVCRYDALHQDGHVETDVALTVMYRGSPADFEVVDRVVHEACPEVGTGQWVDAAGLVLDGPGPAGPAGPRPRHGRRAPWPPPSARRSPRRLVPGRVVVGAIGMVVGIVLLVTTGGDGPLAALGTLAVLCSVATVATVATTLQGRSRRARRS